MSRKIFKAQMETVYYTDDEADYDDCIVIFEGDEIEIYYGDMEDPVIYKGKKEIFRDYPTYIVRCTNPTGIASLYQIPSSKILLGYWQEDGEKGFWRIKLGDQKELFIKR